MNPQLIGFLLVWLAASLPAALLVGWLLRASGRTEQPLAQAPSPARKPLPVVSDRIRVLCVDDDPGLRALLRATFDLAGVELREAADARTARVEIAAFDPDVIVLDIGLPDANGLVFCATLKNDPATARSSILLLSGAEGVTPEDVLRVGGDAFLRKPFSPLAVLETVRRLAIRSTLAGETVAHDAADAGADQLTLYARDLRTLLDIEQGQRVLLKKAYTETVLALVRALESRDTPTGAHAQRVTKYAVELAETLDPELLDDPGVEYGFLLHDVGKIGIPDLLLRKSGPLELSERRLLETHTVLGEQMLGDIELLRGESVAVVKHHHERWDGSGYPDGLTGTAIPESARIFAVADALDAMTSDRPYRRALAWDTAVAELLDNERTQFAPDVIEAFRRCEPRLRRIHYEFAR